VSAPPTNLGRGRKRAAEGAVGARRAGDGARAVRADFVVRRLDGRGPAVVSGRHPGKSTAAPVPPAAARDSACVAGWWWWHRKPHPNIVAGGGTALQRAVRALSDGLRSQGHRAIRRASRALRNRMTLQLSGRLGVPHMCLEGYSVVGSTSLQMRDSRKNAVVAESLIAQLPPQARTPSRTLDHY